MAEIMRMLDENQIAALKKEQTKKDNKRLHAIWERRRNRNHRHKSHLNATTGRPR